MVAPRAGPESARGHAITGAQPHIFPSLSQGVTESKISSNDVAATINLHDFAGDELDEIGGESLTPACRPCAAAPIALRIQIDPVPR